MPKAQSCSGEILEPKYSKVSLEYSVCIYLVFLVTQIKVGWYTKKIAWLAKKSLHDMKVICIA
jgi:hypothetical protein